MENAFDIKLEQLPGYCKNILPNVAASIERLSTLYMSWSACLWE